MQLICAFGTILVLFSSDPALDNLGIWSLRCSYPSSYPCCFQLSWAWSGRGSSWCVWPFPSPEEHVNSAELGVSLCSFPERFLLPLAGFPIRRRNRFLLRLVLSRRPTRCSAVNPRSSSSSSRASWLRRRSTRYWSRLGPVATRTQGTPQGVKKVLLVCASHGHQPLTAP